MNEARNEYDKLRLENSRKLNKHVLGALYKTLFMEKCIILDHDVEGDFDICIEYTLPSMTSSRKCNNQEGQPLPVPTSATTWVKVRSAFVKNPLYLHSLLNVDRSRDEKKGIVRQNRGDVGFMWQVGVKNRGLRTRTYYKATESTFRVSEDNEIESPLLRPMNYFMTEYFQCEFQN